MNTTNTTPVQPFYTASGHIHLATPAGRPMEWVLACSGKTVRAGRLALATPTCKRCARKAA